MILQEMKGMPEASSKVPQTRGSTHVAEARARAQRAKLDTQKQERIRQTIVSNTHRKANGKSSQQDLQTTTTIVRAIDDYLQGHEGGNHSDKALE